MSQVSIDKQSRVRAMKSLTNKYKQQFGEDVLKSTIQTQNYSEREWIMKYAENIKFWKDEVPDLVPNMTQFSMAKHAICTNAISQLWIKCEEMHVKDQVQSQLDTFFLRQN
jgi:hypothetical protein